MPIPVTDFDLFMKTHFQSVNSQVEPVQSRVAVCTF